MGRASQPSLSNASVQKMIKMTTVDFMFFPGVGVGWTGGVDADDGV